jgi:predicted amidohydrolase YtcJ
MQLLRALLLSVLTVVPVSYWSLAQQPATAHVKIVVTDQSGARISEAMASLELVKSGAVVRATAGAEGVVGLDLSPGTYQATVAARGFQTWKAEFDVDSGTGQWVAAALKIANDVSWGPSPLPVLTPVEALPPALPAASEFIPMVIPRHPFVIRAAFKMQKQASTAFDVAVKDISGAVVPGATIEIDPMPCVAETAGTADRRGRVKIAAAPGMHTVVVSYPGFARWSKEIDLRAGRVEPVAAALSPGQTGGPVVVAGYPDRILLNGTILTGNCLEVGQTETVSAMAISGGKVSAIGSDAEMKRLAGPQTVLIDLNGGFVMPGLNDAHVHLGSAGQTKLNVDLTGSASLDEMLKRIRAKAATSPAGHWLTGGGWDHTLWAIKTLPSRQDLDQVTGDHPALLERIDGHIAIANTAALKAAGITGKSKAPQGGCIDLDASGEPTGILRDTEMEEFEKIIPPPTAADRKEGLSLAIQDALSHGLTSVQDNSEWEDFLVMEELEREGKLSLRISEWLPFAAPIDELKDHRAHHDANDPLLHTGMLKGFMDGSLGSRTAALKAPYADDPKNSGLARYDQTRLNAMAIERARAGFQIGFHAIGDEAAAMALEAFSQTYDACPDLAPQDKNPYKVERCWPTVARGHRDRIEHAQVVDPGDIPRFKKLGVIASMQPNHLLTDMNWALDRLGNERAASSYAWKAYLDEGVVLAFGTDYPVEPVTPFRGLYAAVTRTNEAGTKTYFPESKLTRAQAIFAYTQGSAYAEFEEKQKGKLMPGYDADYILLDRNLLTVPPAEILKTHVLETVIGGKPAYKSSPSAQ